MNPELEFLLILHSLKYKRFLQSCHFARKVYKFWIFINIAVSKCSFIHLIFVFCGKSSVVDYNSSLMLSINLIAGVDIPFNVKMGWHFNSQDLVLSFGSIHGRAIFLAFCRAARLFCALEDEYRPDKLLFWERGNKEFYLGWSSQFYLD